MYVLFSVTFSAISSFHPANVYPASGVISPWNAGV
jgi:hypothetical protein